MASTGEGGPQRRLRPGRALLRYGMSSLVFENPYYGLRAPDQQTGTDLLLVADLLRMCRGAVQEARALVGWLQQQGHRHVGVSGYSMGGHMAGLVAATSEAPLACSVLAAGQSSVPIFCEGALSSTICWSALGDDRQQALLRMAELVGAADLDRFGVPARCDAAVILGAQQDAYVAPEQVKSLSRLWPGSDLRWCRGGHVTTYLWQRPMVHALRDAMVRLMEG